MRSMWTSPSWVSRRAQGKTHIEDPILRMRNARQSETASDAGSVFKYEVGVCGHGGHARRRFLRGPRGEYHLSEVPFCEYVMRGSPVPHPTLLVFIYIKCPDAAMVGISTVRISEAPGVNIVHWRSHFANTQCEAVQDRTRRSSGLSVPNMDIFQR